MYRRFRMREILILVTSLHRLRGAEVPFVYTDRHAYLRNAHYSSDLNELPNRIDWDILQRSDFQYDAQDPGKMERYQAEALVYQQLGFEHVICILAYDDQSKADIERVVGASHQATPVRVNRRFFF